MVFLTKTNDYQKLCDTSKNVIKMDMIIKEVYSRCWTNLKGKRYTPPQTTKPSNFGDIQ